MTSTVIRLPGHQHGLLWPTPTCKLTFKPAGARSRHSVRVLVRASAVEGDIGTAGKAAIAGGLIAAPTVLVSEYVLRTTGEGLPPGPGGIFGALEGISYLVVLGIVGWSVATKVKTGSGLPSGPAGLLGAVEGLSFLALLGGVVVFGLEILEKGSLPGITGR